MKTPLQIGITGGIGSGKSVVCRVFQTMKIPVYDADSRAKALMTTDGILISAIKKEFGVLSYHKDGSLNRTFLAEQVFDNEEKLARLNKLVHPRVGVDYGKWLSKQSASPYVIKEAALIFEVATNKLLDKVIVVHASEELRLGRVLSRDLNRSEKQVRDIMQRQMPEEERMSRADYIITNDESELIIPQIVKLDKHFRELASA